MNGRTTRVSLGFGVIHLGRSLNLTLVIGDLAAGRHHSGTTWSVLVGTGTRLTLVLAPPTVPVALDWYNPFLFLSIAPTSNVR